MRDLAIMAAPPPLFSDLYGDATKWDEPNPDYNALILRLGGVAGTGAGAVALFDRDATAHALANLATRSPTLIAFCPSDDNEHIYVGHSLSIYPADPLATLSFDNDLITLVGNDPDSCQPVAIPRVAFTRTNVRAKTIDEIRGANGFSAAVPVLRQGPHAAGDPDTNDLSVRRVMLIPTHSIPDIMTYLAGGYYTYQTFYNEFLDAPLTSGVGAVVALYTPLAEWWRAVSTNTAAGSFVFRRYCTVQYSILSI